MQCLHCKNLLARRGLALVGGGVVAMKSKQKIPKKVGGYVPLWAAGIDRHIIINKS